MGKVDSDGKQGVFVEGRASEVHTHRDGSTGRDVEAYSVRYNAGKEVSSSKMSGYGKLHTNERSGRSGK